MKKYDANIGDQSLTLYLNEKEVIHLGDEVIPYSFTQLRQNTFLLRYQNKTYEVFVSSEANNNADDSVVTLYLNGQRFEVTLEDERHALVKKFGLSDASKKIHAELRAPMPGLITKIEVHEGDQVEEGQGLVVLEAMKMENELKSPRKGTISKIFVQEKQTVDKNTVLIELA